LIGCFSKCVKCSAYNNCEECDSNFKIIYHNAVTNFDECVNGCKTGLFVQNDICVACDSRCKSCIGPTNKNCTECDETAELNDSNLCECKKGNYFDLVLQKCTKCPNPLCESCNPNSAVDMTCLKCSSHPNVVSNKHGDTVNLFDCYCMDKTTYNSNIGLCIFDNNYCHGLCKNGCSELNNPSKCVNCKDGINIEALKNVNKQFDCSCTNGAVLIGDKCGFTECNMKYCAGCYYKNNKTNSCFKCLNGIIPIYDDSNIYNNGIVQCQCPLNQFYLNSTCVSPKNESCHPLCKDSCLLPNDSSKCMLCKEDYVSVLLEDGYFNCTCPIGSVMNSNGMCDPACGAMCEKCINHDLCEKCSSANEGIILFSNKCKCSTAKGYILQDGKCIKKSDSQAQAGQIAGTVIMGTIISSAVIGPGIGTSFWKFIGMSQELALLAIINSPDIPQSYISVIQGSSFINFQFLDSLFEYLPAYLRGDVEYNLIEDGSFQYHPSISGKMFLVNIMNQLLILIVSLFGYFTAVVLALKFAYFQSYKKSFIFCGMIRLVQACFNDIILCAFIQLKYPNFKNSQYYSINYFSAIFAVLFECGFIAFNLWVILKPAKYLNKKQNKSKYGAFYEDFKIYHPVRLTPLLNNIRLFVMICVMVFTVDYNLVQSLVYFIFSFFGFAWEFSMSPYEEKLVFVQVNLLNFIKVFASLGFIFLCSPYTTEFVKSWIYQYEITLFLTSLCSGMLISIIQQVIGVIDMIKSYCVKKSPEKMYIDNSIADFTSQTTQNIGFPRNNQ